MVMGTKNRFSQQLIAVESSLRDNKFTSLGLPYTGNFIENEAEPAASVSQAGQKWDVTAADLKSSKSAEEAAKKDAEEAKAKAQELSLTAEKLSKDLTSTKSDLDSTNSKLKLTAEQLQTYTDELKGKKPAELFTELNDLSEKAKVADSENKLLANAKLKIEEAEGRRRAEKIAHRSRNDKTRQHQVDRPVRKDRCRQPHMEFCHPRSWEKRLCCRRPYDGHLPRG